VVAALASLGMSYLMVRRRRLSHQEAIAE
jgi:hypothetical protein